MLKANNISFSFHPSKPLLSKWSFEMFRGEVVGLMGKSGRGKTTIGKILSGYLRPHSGHVLCPSFKRISSVQMIFQNPKETMNPTWKIGRIIEEGGPYIIEDLKRWKIDPSWLSRYPHELSGGELARVSLARTVRPLHTKYLICDELTSMLDEKTEQEIWENMLKFQKEHQIGLLVISHKKELLSRFCHRMIHLENLDEGLRFAYD
jgi:peptide/nickel transport system ATP-binding protein/Fe3+-transporting ATPase